MARLLSTGAPKWPPNPPTLGAPRETRGAPRSHADRNRRHALTRHGIGDRVLQAARRPPLARGTRPAGRADLVDAPVDLEVVAVGVAELDGELTAGAPPSLEDDGDVVLAQPGPGAEDLVGRAHLECEVIERGALELRRAAHQRHAVMVRAHAHEDHAARHHAVRIPIA